MVEEKRNGSKRASQNTKKQPHILTTFSSNNVAVATTVPGLSRMLLVAKPHSEYIPGGAGSGGCIGDGGVVFLVVKLSH